MTSTASNALVIANDYALANEYDKYKDDVNNSDDELYEDAPDDNQNELSSPDLDTALDEVELLLQMALNNRFNEALALTSKLAHISLYHALGKGTLCFLKGCLTLERNEIEAAMEALRNCVNISYSKKRSTNLVTRVVWRPNYNQYTDEEVHAELCYAEGLLMTALLTFLEDQNLISLVKGAFRIRSCYQSYKECMHILNNRTEWKNDKIKKHFESGVRMGFGTFNLMISHMPTKVIRMLEFVGFSGNRETGFSELEQATQLQEGLRCPLAVLIMLCYQTYIEHLFALGNSDLDCVERLLDVNLKKYPKSAFFLLFDGRLDQLRGKLDRAIESFKKCIEIQDEWKQFHNICYWELLWCHAVQCDWENSAKYADILRKQCKWSPATYAYQYATFLYMKMIEDKQPQLKEHISEILKLVPKLKIRYAGKTIPAEKFAVTQSQKYFTQEQRLVLPALEFMYIWNVFVAMKNVSHLFGPMLDRVERELFDHKHDKNLNDYPLDDYSLLMLLKGLCLRNSGFPLQATECFMEVLNCEKRIIIDTFLPPHASLELGLTHLVLDNLTEARYWLEKAKKDYSGYLLETIVHFRVHTATRIIRTKLNQRSNDAVNDAAVHVDGGTNHDVDGTKVDFEVVHDNVEGVGDNKSDGSSNGDSASNSNGNGTIGFSSMLMQISKRMQQFNVTKRNNEDFTDSYQAK